MGCLLSCFGKDRNEQIKAATENFSIKYKIGSGSFGIVYGTEAEPYGSIAVKRIKQSLISEEVLQEYNFLLEYEHVNLVRLFGSLVIDRHFCLIMEFVVNGSLRSKLKEKDSNLNYWIRMQICTGVAKGIDYLHTGFNKALVHRDIKTDNILLDRDYTPKICDFGLSKVLSLRKGKSSVVITERICGTKAYLPPEALKGHISRRLDVYSFGVVLLENISSKPPVVFDNDGGIQFLAEYFRQCDSRGLKFPVDKCVNWPTVESKEMIKVAAQCLNEDVNKRPYMHTVREKYYLLQNSYRRLFV